MLHSPYTSLRQTRSSGLRRGAERIRCQPSRSGVTLVETVGVMVVVASILSLSAVVLQQAFRSHQESLMHFRNTEQLQRLSERLRRDVHLASSVDADEAGVLVMKMGNEKQILYRQQGPALTREFTVGDGPRKLENWQLPEGMTLRWTVETQGARRLLSTRLENAESPIRTIEWLACAAEVGDE